MEIIRRLFRDKSLVQEAENLRALVAKLKAEDDERSAAEAKAKLAAEIDNRPRRIVACPNPSCRGTHFISVHKTYAYDTAGTDQFERESGVGLVCATCQRVFVLADGEVIQPLTAREPRRQQAMNGEVPNAGQAIDAMLASLNVPPDE